MPSYTGSRTMHENTTYHPEERVINIRTAVNMILSLH